jgi:hypothetical protein
MTFFDVIFMIVVVGLAVSFGLEMINGEER